VTGLHTHVVICSLSRERSQSGRDRYTARQGGSPVTPAEHLHFEIVTGDTIVIQRTSPGNPSAVFVHIPEEADAVQVRLAVAILVTKTAEVNADVFAGLTAGQILYDGVDCCRFAFIDEAVAVGITLLQQLETNLPA